MGIIGVLLGIVLIIYLSSKAINILIAAPIATIVVLLFNNLDIVTYILGKEHSFMSALANYIMLYFVIFLLGSILAKLMEESGATVSIAETILNKVGTENPYKVLVAIFLISALLTYGGISLFVVMFAIIPLARSLFKELDIAWNLIQIPLWLGMATITMTILPGSPSIQNVIPMQYANTTLTAAAGVSIAGAIGCTVFGLVYMRYCLKRSLEKGENFATYTNETHTAVDGREKPSFAASIAPLMLLIILVILGSTLGSALIKKNIIYIALLSSIILSFILFNKFLQDKKKVINLGVTGAVIPIFATAAAVAFGSVVTSTQGFTVFSEWFLNIKSPQISLAAISAALSGITGSSSGALGIVMPQYAQHYLNAGLHPELVHRIAAVGTNILTIVPQSGVLLTFLSLTGLTHKNGFKETFITVSVGSLIAMIIIITLGLVVY